MYYQVCTLYKYVYEYVTKQFHYQENSQSNSDSHKEIATDSTQLVVGSVIQYGEPEQCGIIKWMGNLPNETEVYAGLEMVRHSYNHF